MVLVYCQLPVNLKLNGKSQGFFLCVEIVKSILTHSFSSFTNHEHV